MMQPVRVKQVLTAEDEEAIGDTSTEEESADEPTQEELNQQLKENAKQVNLNDIEDGLVESGEQVYLEGEVVRSEDDPFTTFYGLSTIEDNKGVFT